MRTIKILAFAIGVVGFGALAAANLFELFGLRDDPERFVLKLIPAGVWTIILLLASSMCMAGVFNVLDSGRADEPNDDDHVR
jgi:hypothetical protein